MTLQAVIDMPDADDPVAPGMHSPASREGICPYLLSADGTWRATRPSAEHRCTAVSPAEPLRADKQRRLCLGTAHLDCPSFRAAREARAAALGPFAELTRGHGRVYARGTAIVLDRPRPVQLALSGARDWLPQVVLIVMMLLAAAALILARFAGP